MEHLVDSSEERIVAEIKCSNDSLKAQIQDSEASITELLSEHQELIQLSTARTQHQDEKVSTAGVIANAPSTAAMTGLIREAQNAYKQLETKQAENAKLRLELKQKEEELRQKETNWDQERGHFHRELERSRGNQTWFKRERELYQRKNTNLSAHTRELSRQLSSQPLNNQAHNTAETSVVVTPMKLLEAIGVSPNATWRDMERVVQQAIHFNAESQGKVEWLLKSPEFRSWMQDRRSSILLADGATTGQVLVVSPMSRLCAALAGSLAGDDSETITLSFIAGMHLGVDRTNRRIDGPLGMMRSLVVQLLSSSLLEPQLEFLTPESLQVYHDDDLKALCNLFVRLVRQLPSGIDVFCIVDGISWYEQSPWLSGLLSITDMFEYLVTQLDPKEKAILKLLMTSHGGSTKVVLRATGGKYRQFWRHVTLVAGHTHPGPSIYY